MRVQINDSIVSENLDDVKDVSQQKQDEKPKGFKACCAKIKPCRKMFLILRLRLIFYHMGEMSYMNKRLAFASIIGLFLTGFYMFNEI